LNRQGVDNGGQHPHVVRLDPIHPLLAGQRTPDDVASTDDHAKADAHLVYSDDFVGERVHHRRLDAEPPLSGQRLARQLE